MTTLQTRTDRGVAWGKAPSCMGQSRKHLIALKGSPDHFIHCFSSDRRT